MRKIIALSIALFSSCISAEVRHFEKGSGISIPDVTVSSYMQNKSIKEYAYYFNGITQGTMIASQVSGLACFDGIAARFQGYDYVMQEVLKSVEDNQVGGVPFAKAVYDESIKLYPCNKKAP
ncbi:MAG: hypothetical protein ACRDC6_20500 [Shewanella sp.]